jgi:hypothetical protein
MGLASYAFTNDASRLWRMLENLEAGIIEMVSRVCTAVPTSHSYEITYLTGTDGFSGCYLEAQEAYTECYENLPPPTCPPPVNQTAIDICIAETCTSGDIDSFICFQPGSPCYPSDCVWKSCTPAYNADIQNCINQYQDLCFVGTEAQCKVGQPPGATSTCIPPP